MAIFGVGTDLASISRVREAVSRYGDRFLDRVFTPAEVSYARAKAHPEESLAARFAAKEACFKAIGTGWPTEGVSFRDVEVVRSDGEPPRLVLAGRLAELAGERGVRRFHLSLSHAGDHAIAMVVAEGDG